MSLLYDLSNLGSLTLKSYFSTSTLKRTPEPHSITNQLEAVEDYNEVERASLAVLYTLYLQLIKYLSKGHHQLKAIDLACGPALFTMWLAQYIDLKEVKGVDLSAPMLSKAKARFEKNNMNLLYSFTNQSVTDLNGILDNSYDIATFMDAAHHLNTIKDIEKAILEMERVVHPEGILLISDLVRPKTEHILRSYYEWIAKKNKMQNLEAHNKDFLDSLYAAWTCEELASALPQNTKRKWLHLYPKGFSYIQILLAIPEEKLKTFIFKDIIDESVLQFLPTSMKPLWQTAMLPVKFGFHVKQLN